MNKNCSGCGEKFSCTGTEDCWCYKIKLSKNTLITLKLTGEDCFCEKCLLTENTKFDNKK